MHKFTSNINDTGLTVEAGFTPDSRYVLTGSETSKRVTFFNIETGRDIQLMEFHPKTIGCVKFSHVYCMLVTACQNLVVWIPERVFAPSTNPVPQ
jgi:WD40 repeat protein